MALRKLALSFDSFAELELVPATKRPLRPRFLRLATEAVALSETVGRRRFTILILNFQSESIMVYNYVTRK
jgi:hypothetical protein